MDIGVVHPELIYPRGAERQVCELVNNLTRMGNEVTIYTFETKNDYFFEEMIQNSDIVSLDMKWSKNLPYGLEYPRWLYMAKKLSNNIKDHEILNLHNAPSQWISKFTDIPTVWTCNEPLIYRGINNFTTKFKLEPLIRIDKFFTDVDLILALDSKMETIIKNRYKNPVECLGSGVNLLRQINHINNDFIDIIFVGPIHEQKRPLDIIKAFSSINISYIKVHFVGEILDDKLHANMVKTAKMIDLSIIFHGTVSNDELYNLYDIADLSIFVPEAQPWGIFPLETMLCGIPTIVSDLCGINEFIPNDIFRVETGNINDLSIKITDVIENIDYYKKENDKIAKMISNGFSWEKYAQKMMVIFKRLSK